MLGNFIIATAVVLATGAVAGAFGYLVLNR